MDARELTNGLRLIAQILRVGERTHPSDGTTHWLKLSCKEHAARAIFHLERLILQVHTGAGEDDLANAAARLLLALELRERERLKAIEANEPRNEDNNGKG